MEESSEDDNEKTLKTVKSFLKDEIENLKQAGTQSATKERAVLETQLKALEAREKEVKKLKATIKEKESDLQETIKEKRNTFTEAEAKELILTKFYDLCRNEMYRHLNSRKTNIIEVFEKLWDKYRVPLGELRTARNEASNFLDDHLRELGYSTSHGD